MTITDITPATMVMVTGPAIMAITAIMAAVTIIIIIIMAAITGGLTDAMVRMIPGQGSAPPGRMQMQMPPGTTAITGQIQLLIARGTIVTGCNKRLHNGCRHNGCRQRHNALTALPLCAAVVDTAVVREEAADTAVAAVAAVAGNHQQKLFKAVNL